MSIFVIILFLSIIFFKIDFSFGSIGIIVLSFCTYVGYLSFSYFSNEFYSLESDKSKGKINRLMLSSKIERNAMFIALLVGTVVSWMLAPANTVSLRILLIEFALLFLYVIPMINMRRIPIVSLIIRSIYEFVLPSVLLMVTYSLVGNDSSLPYGSIVFFSCWLLFLGLRSTIVREISELSFGDGYDLKRSVVFLGIKRTKRLYLVVSFLELWLFVTAIYYLLPEKWFVWLLFGAFIFHSLFAYWYLSKTNSKEFFILNDLRMLFDRFYYFILPIVLLTYVGINFDLRWLLVLLLLPLFYYEVIFRLVLKLSEKMTHYTYAFFHHLISRILLLFGIDLKKRKQSVLEFFRIKKMRD